MTMLEKAEALRQYTVDFRRELHMYPEASFQEYRTSGRIKEELDRCGIPWRAVGETGVLGRIEGARGGRTILLRGDMDALSVQEETGLPFASRNDGMMHACGHDAHTAILLTAARILHEMREELSGSVVLAFQPGEEIARGARLMIDSGALDGVDACFSAHVMSPMPYGQLGFCRGSIMSSASSFTIDVQGRSAHGAMPHLSIDPVVTAAAIINSLQAVVSRETDPRSITVVTVGEIHGGTRFNVIADSVRMTGTARTFDAEVYRNLPDMLRRVVEDTAQAYRAQAVLEHLPLCGVTVNDDAMLDMARSSCVKLFGAERAVDSRAFSGSEDFAFFAEQRPSAFVFLGGAPAGQPGYSNHHGKFVIDERVLTDGAALFAQVAADYLQ